MRYEQPTTNEDTMTTQEVNLLIARLNLVQVLHESNKDNNNKAVTDLHRYYGYLFRSHGRLYDHHTKQSYSFQDIETLIRSRK